MTNAVITTGILAAITLAIALPEASAQQRPAPQPAQQQPAQPQPAQQAAAPQPARGGAQQPVADASPAVKDGDVVARIGDSDVTASEVRAAIGFLDPRQQAALARDPALLSQTVRAVLANRLAFKEALTKKWNEQAAVKAQIERVRESVIVESYLKSVTTPPDSYPSEAELKAVYDANASALLVPRRFQLAQVVISLPKDADKDAEEAARKKLAEALKKLKAPGAEFGKLAKSLSEDTASAERDGDLGWIAEPDLRPEIRSQVTGLGKGSIADPVRLDDGWHIIKLLDTEASRTRTLAEVRDGLVQRMRAEKIEANRRAYMNELLKQSPPVLNEIALSRLLDARPVAASR
ncbi:peptidylprolyl isomerase [Rhodopseudomonas sp. NSM]|uniref:peptidylprolyl isomerase n=1 Tax=Rhodopseudomonas sp. NSM TaxID=3457630 RepID=UPI004035B536